MKPDITPGSLARLTGILYLVYFAAGAPLVLRSSLISPGDATVTAGRILASERFYRLTIVTDLVSYALYLWLAYLFYLLLRDVNRRWALLATLFTVVGCVVLITATTALTVPLALLTGTTFEALALPQRQALALLALKVYNQAFIVSLLLFGMQWLIMGPLFTRVVPRLIGYLLTIGGVAWVSFAVVSLLSPRVGVAMQRPVVMTGGLAEIVLAISLLMRRVRCGPTGS